MMPLPTLPALRAPSGSALLVHGLPDPRASLVAAFFAGRNARTLAAYGRDLVDFQAFLASSGIPTADLDATAAVLLDAGHGSANAIALAYRAHLLERQLAPATINRRLAAIRSLVKLGRTLGLVSWTLEVQGVASEAYRDTRGPGADGIRRIVAAIEAADDIRAVRDQAAVRLLYDVAFRRAEVLALDVAHVDLAGGSVAVLGKGRTERMRITLPAPTRAALAAWLAVRGDTPGPLFLNFDRSRKGAAGGRLTGRSLARIVKARGEGAGVEGVRPHGFRHAAITEALDRTNGNVRAVQKFSRHRSVQVLVRYDDNRADLAGDIAAMVAGTA